MAILSSASFANSNTKGVEKDAKETTVNNKVAPEKLRAEIAGETVTTDPKTLLQSCTFTLNIYNTSGEYQGQHVVHGTVSNQSGGYSSCGNFFSRMRKIFSSYYGTLYDYN